MARPWRIEYEGALYHVFSRGNNQQDIFVTDDDRYLFLDTIGQMSEIIRCVLASSSDFSVTAKAAILRMLIIVAILTG